MYDIKIKVEGNRATLTEVESIRAGARNVMAINFEFSSEWKDWVKTVIIYANEYEPKKAAAIILDDNNRIAPENFPSQLIAQKCDLHIGVFGANDDGLIFPTNEVCVHIKDGVPTEGVELPIDTLLYNQIIQIMTDTKAIAENVQAKADNGEFKGKDGKDGKSAYEIAVENGFEGSEEEWLESLGGTGGSGTNDHDKLENIPKINNVELKGELSLDELGIQPKGDYADRIALSKKINIYVGSGAPSKLQSDYEDFKSPSLYFNANNEILYTLVGRFGTNVLAKAHAEASLYYEKQQTYNKEQIDAKINEIKLAQIVDELPEVGLEGVLYCVPKNEPNSNDLYDDYKYINGAWELIGTRTITIDLSNYPTIEDMNNAIGNIQPPTPTEEKRGGILAKSVEDTDGMAEVVIGADGKAYVDALSVDVGGAF